MPPCRRTKAARAPSTRACSAPPLWRSLKACWKTQRPSGESESGHTLRSTVAQRQPWHLGALASAPCPSPAQPHASSSPRPPMLSPCRFKHMFLLTLLPVMAAAAGKCGTQPDSASAGAPWWLAPDSAHVPATPPACGRARVGSVKRGLRPLLPYASARWPCEPQNMRMLPDYCLPRPKTSPNHTRALFLGIAWPRRPVRRHHPAHVDDAGRPAHLHDGQRQHVNCTKRPNEPHDQTSASASPRPAPRSSCPRLAERRAFVHRAICILLIKDKRPTNRNRARLVAVQQPSSSLAAA